MKRDIDKLRAWQQRSRKPLKRTKLQPVSQKRKSAAPARKQCLVVVRERCGGRCEFPDCQAAMQDGHERLARSQGGSPSDPENVIGLCRPHHEWVTQNMNAARTMGLAK